MLAKTSTLFWDCEDPGFALEQVPIGRGATAAWYLHGVCGIFALALHDIFGYAIVVAAEENIDGSPLESGLVHVYCQDGDYYIDVRGVTDNWDAFIDEFADFLGGYDDEYAEMSADDLRGLCGLEMSAEEFEWLYQAAAKLIQEHYDDYNTR